MANIFFFFKSFFSHLRPMEFRGGRRLAAEYRAPRRLDGDHSIDIT